MAPHSSTLAWKIPWMEEPGRLQSTGSWRVGQDWATSFSLFIFMHWRRKWQPTPVFLPGESQGRESLVGCHLWVHTELDMTEVMQQQQQQLLGNQKILYKLKDILLHVALPTWKEVEHLVGLFGFYIQCTLLWYLPGDLKSGQFWIGPV